MDCTWVEQARADQTKGKTGLTTAEREELVRLRKDVRELRMERDVLKKVVPSGICVGNSARKAIENAYAESFNGKFRVAASVGIPNTEKRTLSVKRIPGARHSTR